MKIENKTLFNFYKLTKSRAFCRIAVQGYKGGITIYATDGIAAYRQTIAGDNQNDFTAIFDKWTDKDGWTDTGDLESLSDKNLGGRFFDVMKTYFELERFNSFSVNADEFKRAVRGADIINRGHKDHDIILSVYNSKLDIASWTSDGESAAWQIDGDFTASGAVCVSKKYLGAVKSSGKLELSYTVIDRRVVLCVHGDTDCVIMPKAIDDAARFFEVLEYEYNAPVKPEPKPELKPIIAEKPRKQAKTERKPARRTPAQIMKITVSDYQKIPIWWLIHTA